MSAVSKTKKGGKPKAGGQKKGKTKASVNKASLGKLANKKNNRLAKQGKLLTKGEKKKKKRRAQQEEADKKTQHQANQAQLQAVHDQENDIDSAEEEVSAEEGESFQYLKNAKGFVSADLTLRDPSEPKPRGKKRKANDDEEDDDEEEYERQPRTFAKDKEKDMKMMLPIISKGKVIKRMVKQEEALVNGDGDAQGLVYKKEDKDDEDDVDDVSDDEQANNVDKDERGYLESLNTAQQFAYCKNKLEEKKEQIASLSHCVLGDPQNNMKKLKELRLLLGSQDPGIALSVRKYAIVSLMEVFKDIVPGYRLRLPTEKERSQRVKKETKTLLDYEASFLLNYKVYLEFLNMMAKEKQIYDKTFLTKHGITNFKLSKPARFELGKLGLRCLCEMLTNHPHFNYRDNIILSVIPFANHEDPEYVDIACGAIKKVFKQDKLGDVTLEVVRAIGKMCKREEFEVEPQVLETFLVLNIKEVDLDGAEKAKKMERKEKFQKYSRRDRKRLKAREALDNELLETKATADKTKKLKLHTEVIQAVFESYIRVIKQSPDSALLPAVLEGLAKFAHLINIEYFDSLFSALNGLLESGNLSTRENLHCMQTAFTILSGQGSVINIDPARFYKHFYNNMIPVHAGTIAETVPVVLDCLDVMISKRRKQVSQQRILAFIKRLTTLSLQQNSGGAVAYLSAVRQYIHSFKYSDVLYDNEVQGSGVYLPYLEDPEHCCANSTVLWELHLLRNHFDPTVQRYSKHMLLKAPLAGQGQLPQYLTRKSAKQLYEELQATEGIHAIPEKSAKKKRRQVVDHQRFLEFIKSVSAEGVKLLEEDKVVLSKEDIGTS